MIGCVFVFSQFDIPISGCPMLPLQDPTIVHEGARYSALEQDLPPRVKCATPTNEISPRPTRKRIKKKEVSNKNKTQ